jgi:nitroreductase
MNNFLDIIKNRNSCRSFINEEISLTDIETILEVASNAPSGANMQPFNIYHVSGDKLKEVTNDLIEYVSNGNPISQDIQYYPINWINPYKKRRLQTGAALYELLDIDRKDKEKRNEQWFDNFRWFNSQNVFFFTIDKQLIDNSQGMLIDSGILLQTMILASESLGYKCCPQGATTEYGHIIKKTLGIEDNEAMLFSLVVGKPTEDLINTYRPIKINYKDTTKHMR